MTESNFREDYIKKLENSNKKYLDIIATYIRVKKLPVDNIGQAQAIVKRNVKIANELKDFPDDKIIRSMEKLQKNYERDYRIQGDNAFKWTLESVLKELIK